MVHIEVRQATKHDIIQQAWKPRSMPAQNHVQQSSMAPPIQLATERSAWYSGEQIRSQHILTTKNCDASRHCDYRREELRFKRSDIRSHLRKEYRRLYRNVPEQPCSTG
jgi:hypothetical protein